MNGSNHTGSVNRYAALAVLWIAIGGGFACDETTESNVTAGGVVYVRLELPDGRAREVETMLDPNSEVLTAMERLRAAGSVDFGVQGTGENAFIDEIDGVRNLAPDGPYWVYAVNGRLADRGVGQFPLTGGDRVRWCYTKYEDRSSCATQ